MKKQTNRVIIFYYEWPNVSGNHAGMAYFFRCFKKSKIGIPVILIKTPRLYTKWPYRLRRAWQKLLVKYVTFKENSKDIIFFVEYLGGKKPGDHREIALELQKATSNTLVGLIHLPIQTLINLYDYDYISKSLSALDRIIVFGGSLAQDLSSFGYSKKIIQTYHYVDTSFYKPANRNFYNDNFTVISLGFLYRNRSKLMEIVEQCPKVTFELCLGNNVDLHNSFTKFKNVRLNKFIPENELLAKMQKADVSLSVFDDTIGSNVIVTSLACGLPQVVSDVGSIRDYCSGENAIFCKTIKEFVDAIKFLSTNREKCKQMGINARKRAEELSLEKSIVWYRRFFMSLIE